MKEQMSRMKEKERRVKIRNKAKRACTAYFTAQTRYSKIKGILGEVMAANKKREREKQEGKADSQELLIKLTILVMARMIIVMTRAIQIRLAKEKEEM